VVDAQKRVPTKWNRGRGIDRYPQRKMTTISYIDLNEHTYRLVGAFDMVFGGRLYRMLDLPIFFARPCLITVELEGEQGSLVSLTAVDIQGDDWRTWWSPLQKALQNGEEPPRSLPADARVYFDAERLTLSQVAWFEDGLAKLDVNRLETCGVPYERDGWYRRGWVPRGDEDHAFDDLCGADWKDGQPECDENFRYFQLIYRLAASVLLTAKSVAYLVSRQGYFYKVPQFEADPMYIFKREQYVFELIE
jgi:hypothetical protein